jgi:hypothetical protein
MRHWPALVALLTACGGDDTPLDPSALTGVYDIRLRGDENNLPMCLDLTYDVAAGTATGCTGMGTGTVTVSGTGLVIRFPRAADTLRYAFSNWRGTVGEAFAEYEGPCSQPIGNAGCRDEAGTATFRAR